MKLTIGLTVFYSYTWRRGWVDLIMLNQLLVMLTSIFKYDNREKRKLFVSKQGQPQSHIH